MKDASKYDGGNGDIFTVVAVELLAGECNELRIDAYGCYPAERCDGTVNETGDAVIIVGSVQ